MPEVPAAWAAPGASAAEAMAATQPQAAPTRTRTPQPHGHEGLRPIPLRPLTVLELIDGAIGAVRAVPPALLGWASLLVTAAALADFALTWLFDAAVAAATREHPVMITDAFDNTVVQYGRTIGAGTFGLVVVNALLPVVCSGFAVTILAGLLAEPVRRYVDGATTDAPAPTVRTRRLLGRLSAVAAVAALPRAILLALFALVELALVGDPQGDRTALFWLLILVGVPLCAWLTADWAVAAPVAALEDRPLFAALGRARGLVSGGRWRTLWVTLFTLLIAAVVVAPLLSCQYYIGSVHEVGDLFDGDPVSGATYWWLAGYVVLVTLIQVLAAPYRAAVATMLYVDRRFRREGLDIRIAWARVARGVGNRKGR
jgi:hypothetical protein